MFLKRIKINVKYLLLSFFSIAFFWCYIYRFKIVGFPFSTSQLLAIFGCFFILLNSFFKKTIKFDSYLIVFFICFIIPIFFIMVTSVINGQSDFSIVSHFLGIPWNLLAFYCFKYYRKNTNQSLTFEDIAYLFIFTGLIQCFISSIAFFNPDIGKFLISIQDFGKESENARANMALSRRLVGLGSRYFGAGIVYSIDLVLIAQMMTDKKYFTKNIYKYLPIIYIIIFSCGMMTARTTIVGLFFSIFFFIRSHLKKIIHIFKTILSSFLVILLLFALLSYNYGYKFQRIISFGFEIFINLSTGKGLKTSSSDGTIRMYKFPEENNYKTWIIGDARFFESSGKYYMHTDVGYCRAIYYFGILGILAIIITQGYMALTVINCNERQYRFFFIILCLMYLVFNLKGWAVLYMYLIPFYFVDKSKRISISNKEGEIHA